MKLNWQAIEYLYFTVRSAAVCTVAILSGIGAAFLATASWNLLAAHFHYPLLALDDSAAIATIVAMVALVATMMYAVSKS